MVHFHKFLSGEKNLFYITISRLTSICPCNIYHLTLSHFLNKKSSQNHHEKTAVFVTFGMQNIDNRILYFCTRQNCGILHHCALQFHTYLPFYSSHSCNRKTSQNCLMNKGVAFVTRAFGVQAIDCYYYYELHFIMCQSVLFLIFRTMRKSMQLEVKF